MLIAVPVDKPRHYAARGGNLVHCMVSTVTKPMSSLTPWKSSFEIIPTSTTRATLKRWSSDNFFVSDTDDAIDLFTMDEVKKAVERVKLRKAPGIYGMGAQALPTLMMLVTVFYSALWTTGLKSS